MSHDTQEDTPAMTFEVLKAAITEGSAVRLGRLALAGRRTIDTPNYFAVTSRGSIPHITPDNFKNHLSTPGAYMALEDFIERPQHLQSSLRPPAIYTTPSTPRPLSSFTCTPPTLLTILAARRLPAVAAPKGNTNTAISIFTNTGFQTLTPTAYTTAIATLLPDIAIPLFDLPPTLPPSSKRALRMSERTDTWLSDFHLPSHPPSVSLFAPLLPVPLPLQHDYLRTLTRSQNQTKISGLAVYAPSLLPSLPASLSPLPRLALSAPSTPHAILSLLPLGLDAFVLPFLNAVSDAGVAMTFSFPPPPNPNQQQQPLGIDLHSPAHRTSLAPLSDACDCYACAHHHRAYVHHLLAAREMLGWTLLQIHNHAVVSRFFAGVREALGRADGGAVFEEGVRLFTEGYEAEFPAGTGERPRARGYQIKSEGGEAVEGKKLNKPAWGGLEGVKGAVEGESSRMETPVVPEGGAEELVREGFAEVVGEKGGEKAE